MTENQIMMVGKDVLAALAPYGVEHGWEDKQIAERARGIAEAYALVSYEQSPDKEGEDPDDTGTEERERIMATLSESGPQTRGSILTRIGSLGRDVGFARAFAGLLRDGIVEESKNERGWKIYAMKEQKAP